MRQQPPRAQARREAAGAHGLLRPRELLSQFRNRMDPLGLVHALRELKTKFQRPHRHRTHVRQPHHRPQPERRRKARCSTSCRRRSPTCAALRRKHARLILELAGDEYRFAVETTARILRIRPRLAGPTAFRTSPSPRRQHHAERAQRLNGHRNRQSAQAARASAWCFRRSGGPAHEPDGPPEAYPWRKATR